MPLTWTLVRVKSWPRVPLPGQSLHCSFLIWGLTIDQTLILKMRLKSVTHPPVPLFKMMNHNSILPIQWGCPCCPNDAAKTCQPRQVNSPPPSWNTVLVKCCFPHLSWLRVCQNLLWVDRESLSKSLKMSAATAQGSHLNWGVDHG